MATVLAIGNALVDILVRLPDDGVLQKFHLAKGSMQLVDLAASDTILKYTAHLERYQQSGGSAANTIHGLAKLGISTTYIGKTGNDQLGDFFRNDMKENTISPQLLFSQTPTGRAVALVSPDSERTFATYLGAAVELNDIDLKPETFRNHQYFHVEGYLVQNHALLEKALRIAKENHLTISLDMASYNVVESNRDFLHEMIAQYVDIVFANEDEARAFTTKEPAEAAEIIGNLCDISVVKLGGNGSLIVHKNSICKAEAIKVKPIDTTGAGDLYAAGFIYGLTRDWPLADCARAGAILGGNVIEVMGAKMDEQRWKQVIRDVQDIR